MSRPHPQPSDVERIQRLSALMSSACLALIVGLPLLVLLYWSLADAGSLAARANLGPGAIQGPLQPWQRVAGALLTELPVALMALGLWQARLCFSGFARGEVFTAEAVHCLRRFAAWVFASALAAVLVGAVLSVLLSFGNAAGSRQLSIAIGTDHLFTLLFAAMVWLMAAVIGHGRALAEENAAFL